MHTTIYLDTVLVHNGDYSGEVIIRTVDQRTGQITAEVTTRMEAIRCFVAEQKRAEMIKFLEECSDDEVLDAQNFHHKSGFTS